MYGTGQLICRAVICVALAGPAHASDSPSVRYLDGPEGVNVTAKAATPDASFAIASVGKTMTSVAVLRQLAHGDLELDDPAADWFAPDIVDGFQGLEGVTLRHLLTMTSGLPDYYTDAYMEDVLDDSDLQTPTTALSYAFDDEPLFAPGTGFDYSNTNYVLLGLVLEQVTGLTYAQALQREVFNPAGMTDSFVFGSRPLPTSFADTPHDVRAYYNGAGFGDGGVIATAQDVARFYQALFIQQTLLSPDLLSIMTQDPMNEDYGMGIEIDGPIVGHSGGDLGFSSDVRLHRASGTIAVMVIAEEDADTSWTDDQMPD